MQGAVCLQCSRMFLGPVLPGERLPPHLDAMLGVPCKGSGAPAILGPEVPFEEARGVDMPRWKPRP